LHTVTAVGYDVEGNRLESEAVVIEVLAGKEAGE